MCVKEYQREYQKEYQKSNEEALKEYKKEYSKNNQEKIKEKKKEYYKNNQEKIKEYKKEYQKNNKEAIKEYKKEYRKNNEDVLKEYRKSNAYKEYYEEYRKSDAYKYSMLKYSKSEKGVAAQARRAAAVFRQTPQWLTDREHAQINKMYINKPSTMAIDHIIPIQGVDVSGLNVPWNLQYLPKRQNVFKGRKFDFTNTNESWKTEYIKRFGSLNEE